MESLNSNRSKSLDELNHEETMRDIPLLTYLMVLSLSGIVGNSLVFYIFMNKYTTSTFRMFIICLSSVDLFVCTFSIPLDIIKVILEYKSTNWLCRLWNFFITWPTVTSACLLIAIAIDRYRKVCRPFSWQFADRSARNIFMFCACLSTAISILSPVVSGVRPTKHGVYNITIFICGVTKAMEKTPFPLINNSKAALLFIGALTGIISLYCCIAVRVKQQLKRKQKMLGKLVADCKEKNTTDVDNSIADRKKTSKFDSDTPACSYIMTLEKNMERLEDDGNVKKTDRTLTTKSEFPTQKQSTGTSKNRATFVILMVTSVFFISYVPSITLNLFKTLNFSFSEPLTYFENSVYKFIYRGYPLNSAINPFIYGVFDPHFRKSCKLLCRRFR